MHLLNVNGSQFRLSTPDELRDAKCALNEAALRGGGFVDLQLEGHRMVSVLITPTSSVSLEEEPSTATAIALAEWQPDEFWFDEL